MAVADQARAAVAVDQGQAGASAALTAAIAAAAVDAADHQALALTAGSASFHTPDHARHPSFVVKFNFELLKRRRLHKLDVLEVDRMLLFQTFFAEWQLSVVGKAALDTLEDPSVEVAAVADDGAVLRKISQALLQLIFSVRTFFHQAALRPRANCFPADAQDFG